MLLPAEQICSVEVSTGTSTKPRAPAFPWISRFCLPLCTDLSLLNTSGQTGSSSAAAELVSAVTKGICTEENSDQAREFSRPHTNHAAFLQPGSTLCLACLERNISEMLALHRLLLQFAFFPEDTIFYSPQSF